MAPEDKSEELLALLYALTEGGQFDPSTGGWSGGGGTAINGVTYFAHAGSPAGVVVALAEGDLCIDTSTPALYQAGAAGSANWAVLSTPGTVTVVDAVDVTLDNNSATHPPIVTANSNVAGPVAKFGGVSLFKHAGNPNTAVAAAAVGDLCVDTTDAQLYQATAADNAHWFALVGTPSSPSVYTLTYSTALRTIAAATFSPYSQTSSNTGVTNLSPYGFTTSAELEYITADIAGIITALGELAADVLALKKVVVAVVDDLVTSGLVTHS